MQTVVVSEKGAGKQEMRREILMYVSVSLLFESFVMRLYSHIIFQKLNIRMVHFNPAGPINYMLLFPQKL